MNDAATTHGKELILRRLVEPFPLEDVPQYLMYLAAVLLLGAGIVFALSQKSHKGGALRFWAGIVGLCGFMFAVTYMLFMQVIPSQVALYTIVGFWGALGLGILLCGMLNRTWFTQLLGSLGFLMILFIVAEMVVGVLAAVYVFGIKGREGIPVFGWAGGAWLFVVGAFLLVLLPYIITQYVRDIIYLKGLGIVVGIVLVVARILVALTLAVFFMLPAWQTSEETKQKSKVIVVFDVSDSMTQTRDKVPPIGVALSTMPVRQEEVLTFLETQRPDPKNNKELVTFLQAIQKRNPVTIYRFGAGWDSEFTHLASGSQLWKREITENQLIERSGSTASKHDGKVWAHEDWANFLGLVDPKKIEDEVKEIRGRPEGNDEEKKQRDELLRHTSFLLDNTGSTDVPNSILQILKQEEGNMVQGVVVFTDGRSTDEVSPAYRGLADVARARKIPIFAVRVGEERPKVDLEIELFGPQQVPPDDKFPVKVIVKAKGMSAEKVKALVEIYPPGNDPKAKDAKPTWIKEVEVTLENHEPIQGTEDANIDPEEYGQVPQPGSGSGSKPKKPSDGKKKLAIGDWHFKARLPRDPRETTFTGDEHVTPRPIKVKVTDRPLSVLLFASANTHDYQYLRTLLVREQDEGRLDLSIYVQPAPGLDAPRTNIIQDVEPDRLLDHFPHLFQDPSQDAPGSGSNSGDKWYNLRNYDLIVAFDPDWTNKISNEVIANVEKWVNQGGGLVLVGGPVNTWLMARPGPIHDSLKPINACLPVVLADSRIQELSRVPKEPHPLRLEPKNISPEMEFMNLADDKTDIQGKKSWDAFFWGPKGEKKDIPDRGFFNLYPISQVKKGALVIATYVDPTIEKLKDGTEMPYMAYQPVYGSGKTFWIGSGELWRLRMYKVDYLERFWTKLCRFMGSNNATKNNARITLYMSQRFPTKSVGHVEAQVYDKSLSPLPRNAKPPEFEIWAPGDPPEMKHKVIKMKPKPVTDVWNGWFEADFPVGAPGDDYKLKAKVPDTDLQEDRPYGVDASNPERDNTAPDLKALYYDLATPARDVLNAADKEARAEFDLRHAHRAPIDKGSAKKDDNDKGDKGGGGGDRLYFDLSNADLIPRLLNPAEKSQINKGEPQDLLYDPTYKLPLETWAVIITSVLGGWVAVVFMMQLVRESSELTPLWYLWRALALLPVIVLGAFGAWATWWSWDKNPPGEMFWAVGVGTVAFAWMVVVGLQFLMRDCKSISPLWFVWRGLALLVALGAGFGLWELGTRVQNIDWLSSWLPGADPTTMVTWLSLGAAALVWWSLLTLLQIGLRDGLEVPALWFLNRALAHLAILAVGFGFWALGTVITTQGISTLLNVPMTAALIVGGIIPAALLVWFLLQFLRDWRDLTLSWFLGRAAALVAVLLFGAGLFLLAQWWDSGVLSKATILLAIIVPLVMVIVYVVQLQRDWGQVSARWWIWRGGALAVVGLVCVLFAVGAVLIETNFPRAATWLNGLQNWTILMKPEDSLIPIVMMVVVTLLCFEWLSRKLLRLA